MSDLKRPPKDDELFTPQGGGGGTGSTPMGAVGEEKKGLTLPQVGSEVPGPEKAAPGAGSPGAAGPGGVPGKKEASALRLLFTLAFAGAFSGAVLVFVYLWSQPQILAYRAQVLAESIQEVLKGPDHYQTVFLYEGQLVDELPAGVDSMALDRVYLGFDQSGAPVGFAVQGAEAGFQDVIRLIFGYDPTTRQVLGMKVMDAKETPGLGDKIIKDSVFVAEFNGVEALIDGVKAGRATGAPTEVDMITGATISSRAVIAIINHRIEALGSLLDAYYSEHPPASQGTEGRP
jgi:electron transport complex protein RnfG